MSARSDLHEAVCGDGCGVPSRCARTNRLIDAYAHQLAELQRLRMDELDLTGQKARIVGRIVGLIDPEVQR